MRPLALLTISTYPTAPNRSQSTHPSLDDECGSGVTVFRRAIRQWSGSPDLSAHVDCCGSPGAPAGTRPERSTSIQTASPAASRLWRGQPISLHLRHRGRLLVTGIRYSRDRSTGRWLGGRAPSSLARRRPGRVGRGKIVGATFRVPEAPIHSGNTNNGGSAGPLPHRVAILTGRCIVGECLIG